MERAHPRSHSLASWAPSQPALSGTQSLCPANGALSICLGCNCLLSYKRGFRAGVWVHLGLGLLLRSRHPPSKCSFLIAQRG